MPTGELVRDIGAANEGVSAREASALALSLDALLCAEYGRIHGLAWKFGLPPSEVEDATQEVFARAWANLKHFRGDSEASTWLTRIAVNHFTSRRQTLLRRVRTFLHQPEAVDRAQASALGGAELSEAHERAVACILCLPVKLREVFVLRYLEEMSGSEVAEVLEIPEATVRTRIFNGRKKLREMMKGYWDVG